MSVNNSIFKGDDFKLKFQMLHLGMDVLFVIWSMTIGKIVSSSGHSNSLDSRFFFLVIFLFVASPFILSFFWKVCVCSAKGGTPVFFPLLLSLLFFALLCFSSLFFSLLSVKFQLCFVWYWALIQDILFQLLCYNGQLQSWVQHCSAVNSICGVWWLG